MFQGPERTRIENEAGRKLGSANREFFQLHTDCYFLKVFGGGGEMGGKDDGVQVFLRAPLGVGRKRGEDLRCLRPCGND